MILAGHGSGIRIIWVMDKRLGLMVLIHHLRFEEFWAERLSLLDRRKMKDI